jgi:hypothetical protein
MPIRAGLSKFAKKNFVWGILAPGIEPSIQGLALNDRLTASPITVVDGWALVPNMRSKSGMLPVRDEREGMQRISPRICELPESAGATVP